MRIGLAGEPAAIASSVRFAYLSSAQCGQSRAAGRITIRMPKISTAVRTLLVASAASFANGQCPVTQLTSGLLLPVSITQSDQGNLLVSESGTAAPNTGRISLVDLNGNRRTFLAGLPSGVSDVGTPSGPAGLLIRGRTLYVVIGVGDVGKAGPLPGSNIPNPNPPSSPLFSSILAIHFSADAEKITGGFTLTPADHQALAAGQKLNLDSGGGDKISVELVTNFLPDYLPKPLPAFPTNIGLLNPYGLAAVGDQFYVTDGGQNRVWQVDAPTGAFSTLTQFPPVANPLYPFVGGPTQEAVPTGITYLGGQLLVALFRGIPFSPGTSGVQQVDLAGNQTALITGLKSVIAVLPLTSGGNTDYLVLQHASVGAFFGSPGLLLRFASPAGPPTVLANCLTRPTAMTLDDKSGTVYVIDFAGHLLAIPVN